MCDLFTLLVKLHMCVFSFMFKESKNSENIYLYLLLNISKIEISCLLLYLGIVLKMDKCH